MIITYYLIEAASESMHDLNQTLVLAHLYLKLT